MCNRFVYFIANLKHNRFVDDSRVLKWKYSLIIYKVSKNLLRWSSTSWHSSHSNSAAVLYCNKGQQCIPASLCFSEHFWTFSHKLLYSSISVSNMWCLQVNMWSPQTLSLGVLHENLNQATFSSYNNSVFLKQGFKRLR